MSWQVRDGGVWREVTDPKIEVGGQWVPVVRGLVREGGVWKRFYPESEVTTTVITSGLTGTVPIGSARTVSGTVTALTGVVSGGTVTVYQRAVGGGWVAVGTGTPGTGAVAAWGASVIPTICGASEFKAVYSGSGTNEPSESGLTAVTTIISAPVKPVGGAITNTTMALTWTAVPGAASYEVYRGGVLVASPTAASHSATGLASGTTYSWTVKAVGAGCTSALSPALVGTTSQDAVRDTGTLTVTMDALATGSWRDDVANWTYIADRIGQAYYSSSGAMYTGCLDFGGAARVQAIMEAALGANGALRFTNGTVTGARVYLFRRTNTGVDPNAVAKFQVSASAVGVGTKPVRTGTVVSVATSTWGSGKWYAIGAAHGTAIAKGTSRSVVLYDTDGGDVAPSNYAQFNGKSGGADDCDMQVDWSWDYQLSNAVVGGWQ